MATLTSTTNLGATHLSTDENLSRIHLTADIVSAYVQKNPVPASSLPELIASVDAALSGIVGKQEPPASELKPAVNPKRSVFPDYIVSLEDGRKFKSLKRH